MEDTTAPNTAPESTAEAELPFEVGPAYDFGAAMEQARAAAEAEGRGDPVEAPAPAAEPEPVDAPAATAAPLDYDALSPDEQERLAQTVAEKRNLKPADPPPDPLATLRASVAPELGWDGRYEQLHALTLDEIPPNELYADALHPLDPSKRVTREEAQQIARAEVKSIERSRALGDKVYDFVDRALRVRIGDDLQQATDPDVDRAALRSLVVEGKTAELVDTVASSVRAKNDAAWQAKWDAREKELRGQLAQKDADLTEARAARITRATSPDAGGGRQRSSRSAELFGGTSGRLSEAVIEQARRGQLASLSLADE